MYGYNQVTLVGNLAADPELKYTVDGTAVTQFDIAVNRRVKSGNEYKDDVDFFTVNVWGKQAESVAEYLEKGSPVLVAGRLKKDVWQDNENKTRSRIKIVAGRVLFLASKPPQSTSNGPQDTPSDDPFGPPS